MSSDFTIFIPTLGRATTKKQTTLNQFLELDPDLKDTITLVCPKEEMPFFLVSYGIKKFICPEQPGIGHARQAMLRGCETPFCFMVDDDMRFAVRDEDAPTWEPTLLRPARGGDLIAMMNQLTNWLRGDEEKLNGFLHVGVSARQGNQTYPKATCDPDYPSPWHDVGRVNNFHGFNVKEVLSLMHEYHFSFTDLPLMEDFHVTLSLLRLGCPNRITYRYCWNQLKSGAKGGCSTYRDAALQEKAARMLVDRHPDFVTLKEKSAAQDWSGVGETRMDVIIQWREAFKKGL